MRYRGFIITSRFDRWTEERTNGAAEECSGFCCRVYNSSDGLYENMLDEFELIIGRDIEDMSDTELDRGIIQYTDEHYERLNEAVSDVISNRNADLLGRLICYIGENECGKELYNTLSNEICMTDDEIRKAGFTSLAPCFEKESYAQTIAEYLIDEGTASTFSGNYHFDYTEINEHFGVALPVDDELLDMIVDSLDKDIVADVVTGKDIDIMFYTKYCPNVEDEESELPEFIPQM
ncbi:MAG: hypothetical protein PHV32_02055 [Eubacteriales bacterium]|nr:hypothetical protein [Eubacteriales bacterium]